MAPPLGWGALGCGALGIRFDSESSCTIPRCNTKNVVYGAVQVMLVLAPDLVPCHCFTFCYLPQRTPGSGSKYPTIVWEGYSPQDLMCSMTAPFPACAFLSSLAGRQHALLQRLPTRYW